MFHVMSYWWFTVTSLCVCVCVCLYSTSCLFTWSQVCWRQSLVRLAEPLGGWRWWNLMEDPSVMEKNTLSLSPSLGSTCYPGNIHLSHSSCLTHLTDLSHVSQVSVPAGGRGSPEVPASVARWISSSVSSRLLHWWAALRVGVPSTNQITAFIQVIQRLHPTPAGRRSVSAPPSLYLFHEHSCLSPWLLNCWWFSADLLTCRELWDMRVSSLTAACWRRGVVVCCCLMTKI